MCERPTIFHSVFSSTPENSTTHVLLALCFSSVAYVVIIDADLSIPKPRTSNNRGTRTPYKPKRIILRVAPKTPPLSSAVAASRPGSLAVARSRSKCPFESCRGCITPGEYASGQVSFKEPLRVPSWLHPVESNSVISRRGYIPGSPAVPGSRTRTSVWSRGCRIPYKKNKQTIPWLPDPRTIIP